MGYEYKLKLGVGCGENIETVLKALSSYDKSYEVGGRVCHDFRIETNIGEMPSATVEIEDEGLYFCDHGTGAEILNELQRILAVRFGPVQCNEV